MKRHLGAIAASLVFLATVTSAKASTIALDFNSLPSAQGWTYNTSGQRSEGAIFSVDGTTLHQDTMGTGVYSYGGAAFQYYTMDGVFAGTQAFSIEVRARVTASERYDTSGFNVSGIDGNGEGFAFALASDSIQFLDPLGRPGVYTSMPFDNTTFHLYRLEATPGLGMKLFIDGSLFTTWDPIPGYGSLNELIIGDASSGGNAMADVTYYQFQQPLVPAVPEPMPAALLGLGLVTFAVRRSAAIRAG